MKKVTSIVLAGVLSIALPAFAQSGASFPNKPLRIIVPISPGSATDILVRAVAERMQIRLGVPVLIENRAGAGTTVGAALVAKAEADGYTLLANSNAHTLSSHLYRSLPYDPVNDFVNISALGSLPNILVVAPQSPYNSVQDLLAAARQTPGKLNYASAGNGTGTHLNGEKFRIAAGIQVEHIAFKGTPEAMTDTMAGRVDWFFAPGVSVLNQVREKKLKALAVGSKERLSQLPDLPTTEEAGVPNSHFNLWIALFAPAKTPSAVLTRLNQEVVAALGSAEVKDRLSRMGAEPMPMTLEASRSFIAQEFKLTEQLVKAINLKPAD